MEHMHKNILIAIALLIATGVLVHCYRIHQNCSANVAVQNSVQIAEPLFPGEEIIINKKAQYTMS